MKKITKSAIYQLNQWLTKYCFACMVRFGAEWCFCPCDNIIEIPRKYSIITDRLFLLTFYNLGLQGEWDAMTLSFLHELGHAQTIDLLSDKDYNLSIERITDLETQEEITFRKRNISYWNTPLERAANEWAVKFTYTNPKACKELQKIIEKNIKYLDK